MTGVENILVFDGAIGGFNVSSSLAAEIKRLAPDVAREVDQVLMPKWLKQRGIDSVDNTTGPSVMLQQ